MGETFVGIRKLPANAQPRISNMQEVRTARERHQVCHTKSTQTLIMAPVDFRGK